MRSLINNFINDLRIESVKLQLQLSAPAASRQDNDVLGNITDGELDADKAMAVIREAMRALRVAETVTDLQKLFECWNQTRIEIQYEGYGYSQSSRTKRKAEAYAYVFLMRVLKKRHKELFQYMKMAPL